MMGWVRARAEQTTMAGALAPAVACVARLDGVAVGQQALPWQRIERGECADGDGSIGERGEGQRHGVHLLIAAGDIEQRRAQRIGERGDEIRPPCLADAGDGRQLVNSAAGRPTGRCAEQLAQAAQFGTILQQGQ
jgi:hypothetical protein